ncbi:MAG: OprD family outer membrane porin [Saprospiraceae bacterium]|nr:OprD family outer membrane porin [Saprospiraceae bacterium]
MNKSILIMGLMLGFNTFMRAQHQEVHEKPDIWKGKQNQTEDTTSLLNAFKKGHIHGHFRYYFMATDNEKNLSDYHANAAGGGIRFETANFHGFQFGVSGFYVFNLGSSDLTKLDPTTGQSNRYEIGLFDQEDPTNGKDIDRLEEFFLKYNYKKSHISFGRQLLNTPFINLQDGRMRPTGVEGVWGETNDIKNTKIEGGWLYAISPRGTTKWYSVGESIGLYPVGVNTEGVKSGYADHLESKGIAMLGVNTNVNKFLKVQAWEMYVENILNTVLLQVDAEFSLKNTSKLFAAGQIVRQNAIKEGGNDNPTKTYFEKDGKSLTYGAKVGWKNKDLEASFNYNRITAEGRYLMPREWGREPFFTFMPRERNEGLGDVHAFMGKINYNMPKKGLKTSLAMGYYQLPDVKNFRLNKYGLPSYAQINADVRYTFEGTLKGLEAQLLLAHKFKNGYVYDNYKFVINKVNMTLYNFILNYHF